MKQLEKCIQTLKEQAKYIDVIDSDHVEKVLILETRNISILEFLASKVTQYAKKFKKLLILPSLFHQHIYPYSSLIPCLFELYLEEYQEPSN